MRQGSRQRRKPVTIYHERRAASRPNPVHLQHLSRSRQCSLVAPAELALELHCIEVAAYAQAVVRYTGTAEHALIDRERVVPLVLKHLAGVCLYVRFLDFFCCPHSLLLLERALALAFTLCHIRRTILLLVRSRHTGRQRVKPYRNTALAR